jgi:hypothetical protein
MTFAKMHFILPEHDQGKKRDWLWLWRVLSVSSLWVERSEAREMKFVEYLRRHKKRQHRELSTFVQACVHVLKRDLYESCDVYFCTSTLGKNDV